MEDKFSKMRRLLRQLEELDDTSLEYVLGEATKIADDRASKLCASAPAVAVQ